MRCHVDLDISSDLLESMFAIKRHARWRGLDVRFRACFVCEGETLAEEQRAQTEALVGWGYGEAEEDC